MSICSRTEEGGTHVTVRCAGCGSLHHTKNIGSIDPITHVVTLERSLFDTTPCQCIDPKAHPLVHVCGIDCGNDDPEAKAAIDKKYKALLENNIQRISILIDAELDPEVWKFLQQWDNPLAAQLLKGTATEEQIAHIKDMNARWNEVK